jgi:hypothetical protein
MDWKTVATLLVTVVLAFAGYTATYRNGVRLAQRKEHLERIERQLRELYGPLFALVRASREAWQGFRAIYRPAVGSYWRSVPPPTEQEAAAWRLWMAEVFWPLSSRMAQLVTTHADLIEESEMPTCLLTLCAHVEGYRAILCAWKNGDFSQHLSVVDFPSNELREYTGKHYDRLKHCQSVFLGQIREK